jgi:hypothetical protein
LPFLEAPPPGLHVLKIEVVAMSIAVSWDAEAVLLFQGPAAYPQELAQLLDGHFFGGVALKP